MGTIAFIHGTGVRRVAYSSTLELITTKAAEHLPRWSVVGIPWGDAVGARLHQNGDSVPEYSESRGDATTAAAEANFARWELLSHDPLIELLILPAEGYIGERPGEWIWRQIPEMAGTLSVTVLLKELGLLGEFDRFLAGVRQSDNWRNTIRSLTQQQMGERVARAITAGFLSFLRESGLPGPNGTQRDHLVTCLTAPLGGEALGVQDWLLTKLIGLGLRVTGVDRRRRGELTDRSNPMVGDILRYQARGAEIRNLVKMSLSALQAPVVLLGHSLGGVACVDLLAEEKLSNVTHLITVGSQAPHFYELDALTTRRFGTGLPEGFPRWLNIYDPNDLLSYCGSKIFPGQVEDIRVDNGQSVLDSHSAYWRNESVWNSAALFLNRL